MAKYLVTLSTGDFRISGYSQFDNSPKGSLHLENRIVEFKCDLPTEEELKELLREDTGRKDSYGYKVYNYYSILFMQKLM